MGVSCKSKHGLSCYEERRTFSLKVNMDFSSRGKTDFSYKRKDVTIRYK